MSELKPCPFCGEPAKTQKGIYGYAIWVGCGNDACGLRPSSQFHSDAEAIEAWNRRSQLASVGRDSSSQSDEEVGS